MAIPETRRKFPGHQLLSRFNNVLHQYEICHRQFPDGRSSGLLPDWLDITGTNAKFGGWNTTPSNAFWSSGDLDPWRSQTVFSEQPSSPQYKITQNIRACGQSSRNAKDEIFGPLCRSTLLISFHRFRPVHRRRIFGRERWKNGCDAGSLWQTESRKRRVSQKVAIY
ncbi:uncharacterized protein PV09_00367 [Verruconis gallopava]|uniref:Uncharacterized protein n=1 Tax=Verruconis gallopava TaxID=253628 RepID=A0A0D2BDK2_9PEZI|nr:uncharacterized protein PV09_00367 [Verruconis gallopava]KIW09489.1 hypothetical protein PV09_00367 [Verruconis gallopava]